MKQYHKQGRNKVYELLGNEFTSALDLNSIEELLTLVAKLSLKIMVFAKNSAAVQIYSGTVKKLLRTGPWFNVLDPTFNLHLRTEGIANVWLVKKPSSDGLLTSIDILDKDGNSFLVIAESRSQNNGNSSTWLDICESLARRNFS